MVETLAAILAPVIVTVVGGLVSWGIAEGTRYLRAKTRNEVLGAALAQVGNITQSVVSDLEETMKKGMAARTQDGKLTMAEAKALKEAALSRINNQLPAKLEKAARAGVNDLDQYIQGRIEEAVSAKKASVASNFFCRRW